MFIQIVIGAGSVWFKGRLFGSNPKAVYKYHRFAFLQADFTRKTLTIV
jgi:cytochrome b-561 domain-containing protein 2